MISCQQFRTEFVRQSQATIMRKVTMTQFFFVIGALFLSMMVFNVSLFIVPFFVIGAWVLGYQLLFCFGELGGRETAVLR